MVGRTFLCQTSSHRFADCTGSNFRFQRHELILAQCGPRNMPIEDT